MPQLTCTYCSTDLGSTDDHDPGDDLACDCGATYELQREDEAHDLVAYECPYCGTENVRDRGVADPSTWDDGEPKVRCENDDRVDERDGYQEEDCGRTFDPRGVAGRDVESATLKMAHTGWS